MGLLQERPEEDQKYEPLLATGDRPVEQLGIKYPSLAVRIADVDG